MSEKFELTPMQDNAVAAARELGFDFTKNFSGGAKPKIQRIDILHQSGQFQVGEKKFTHTAGYILEYHPENAWWKDTSDDAPNKPPNCFSTNAHTPELNCDRQSQTCAKCPHNQPGSHPDGGKKRWCTNLRILHLFIPGKLFPFRIRLTCSSFGSHDEHITELSSMRMDFRITKVKLTLEEKTEGRKHWSELKFTPVGFAETREEMMEIKAYLDRFSSIFRAQTDEEGNVIEDDPAPAEPKATQPERDTSIAREKEKPMPKPESEGLGEGFTAAAEEAVSGNVEPEKEEQDLGFE